MKNPCWFFLLVLALCASSLFGAPQDITHTAISGYVCNEKARYPYTVKLDMVPFGKAKVQSHYFGYAGKDEFLCSRLSITIGKKNITIPTNAYSDLAEITSVGSPDDHDDGKWTLLIFGGSAGGSYEVELLFDNKRLLERRFIDLDAAPKERKYIKVDKF